MGVPALVGVGGQVAAAVGSAVLFCVWMEALGCLPPLKTAIAYCWSMVVCEAVWALVGVLPQDAAVASVAAVPFCSIALFVSGIRRCIFRSGAPISLICGRSGGCSCGSAR